MQIKVNSPYTFAVVQPGSRFPKIILESGESAPELVGYYSLRQIGIQASDEYRNIDPLLRILIGPEDLSKSTWIIDTWLREEDRNPREQNLALVVRGLPHPERIGRVGRDFVPAFEKELAVLGDAVLSNDREGAYFHVGLIVAMLAELDKAWSQYERRMKLRRDLLRAYVAAVGLGTTIAIVVLSLRSSLF